MHLSIIFSTIFITLQTDLKLAYKNLLLNYWIDDPCIHLHFHSNISHKWLSKMPFLFHIPVVKIVNAQYAHWTIAAWHDTITNDKWWRHHLTLSDARTSIIFQHTQYMAIENLRCRGGYWISVILRIWLGVIEKYSVL